MKPSLQLDQAEPGLPLRIVEVDAGSLGERLAELGFWPDEPVLVLHRAWPGGDPIAVRVGDSLYALRRAEAACVRVVPLAQPALAIAT
jgi:ferrous iron transport protein A